MNVNLCDFVLLRARLLLLSPRRLVEVRRQRRARAQRRQLAAAPVQQRAVLQLYGAGGTSTKPKILVTKSYIKKKKKLAPNSTDYSMGAGDKFSKETEKILCLATKGAGDNSFYSYIYSLSKEARIYR